MNNIKIEGSQFVIKAFNELKTVEEIKLFMIEYFKAFIVSNSKPNNLDFKKSIDQVNKELMIPMKNFIESRKDNMTSEDRKKLETWQESHLAFEKEVIKEIGKFV